MIVRLVRESAGAVREPSLSNSSRTPLPARQGNTNKKETSEKKMRKREKERKIKRYGHREENTQKMVIIRSDQRVHVYVARFYLKNMTSSTFNSLVSIRFIIYSQNG